ncbi:DNA replication and repair protein RecF [Limibacter armeniacum]|uniref:DNA replication/repair protein RecF n=1 Tax=Limibacter armeniacum TaxID=466084 RepID=UPI002FE5515A
MYLQQLNLMNFKNYEEAHITFSPEINCLVGPNGCGKTNMLDAIYYLCMTRSAFSSVESQNVRHKEKYFMVMGIFEKEGKLSKVHCGYQNSKKSFQLNKKEYEKLSIHIGSFSCVLIAPNDTDLVREGSEERRKFFDSIISQANREYLNDLIRYNQVLKQRNNLLKMYADIPHQLDKDLLQPYDILMLELGKKIYSVRKRFADDLKESFEKFYSYLTDEAEEVSMRYKSEVGETSFEENFFGSLQKDLLLQRTTKGIHKDDYDFRINGYPLKKYGSQGQQKSFVIALKLAQFELIYQLTGIKPVLLLDDIFDKLDDARISKLLQMVTEHQFGQIFITDARPERTKRLMEHIDIEVQYLNVSEITQEGSSTT